MGPYARKLFNKSDEDLKDELILSQHFQINASMFSLASDFAIEQIKKNIPFEASVPAKNVFLEISVTNEQFYKPFLNSKFGKNSGITFSKGAENKENYVERTQLFQCQYNAESDNVMLLSWSDSAWQNDNRIEGNEACVVYYGSISRGIYNYDNEIYEQDKFYEDNNLISPILEELNYKARIVDCLLSLICSPSIVSLSSPKRFEKRLFSRSGVPNAVGWYDVEWTTPNSYVRVDSTGKSRNEFTTMPLHFTRGHWRVAKESDPRSRMKDGKWRTFINGFWKGHPSNGIRLHNYTPSLSKNEIAKSKVMVN